MEGWMEAGRRSLLFIENVIDKVINSYQYLNFRWESSMFNFYKTNVD